MAQRSTTRSEAQASWNRLAVHLEERLPAELADQSSQQAIGTVAARLPQYIRRGTPKGGPPSQQSSAVDTSPIERIRTRLRPIVRRNPGSD